MSLYIMIVKKAKEGIVNMAGKKIIPITGICSDPKNQLTVQKSRPLYSLWQSDLSLAEFKILDTYLSRINSHDPDKRVVVFEKGELEKLLGVKKINNTEIKKRLRHLMGNVVEIEDHSKAKSFRLVSLFDEAVAEQDQNGLWEIRLECTQKAMKYFFNVENLGYLRYKLRCVTPLTSRYTYILFVYLESNRFRKSWEVTLPELKNTLNCDKEETYKPFKRFNDLILKKVQKEMHQKTECRYEYVPIKKGRTVVAIRFTIYPLVSIELSNEDIVDKHHSIKSNLLLNDAVQNEFSDEEIQELQSLIVTVPEIKFPSVDGTDNIDIRRYHYLDQKYKAMNVYDKRSKIKNRFAYLKKMITKDTERIGD